MFPKKTTLISQKFKEKQADFVRGGQVWIDFKENV